MTTAIKNSASEAARTRVEWLTKWMKENAPECSKEQKHLDHGTVERAYWHYGYLSALRDILRLLSADN